MSRRARAPAEYWVAYSDVLGNLLLVFVLVLVTAMAHLGDEASRLDASRVALTSRERELAERTAGLFAANRGVAERDRELTELGQALSSRDSALAETRRLLEETRTKLTAMTAAEGALRHDTDALRHELDDARHALEGTRLAVAAGVRETASARSELSTARAELELTRSLVSQERVKTGALERQLRDMVGVRRSIVESLQATLAAAGGQQGLAIDGATGAVRLGDGVLFDESKDLLKPEAEPVLRGFLEKYLQSLLGNPANRAHLAQIEIEGHTNDNGTFEANLDLSYKRARAVLAFLLAQQFPHQEELRSLVKISGRSFSEPIRNPDGSVDKVRSRRIEIKFRLRDEPVK